MAITIGSAYTFASSTGFGDKNFSIAALSDTSFVIVYKRITDGLDYAVAGTISGTAITFGTPVSIGTGGGANKRAVCALSSSLALVIHNTSVSTLSISGTTVTHNTPTTLDASAGGLFSVTALNSTTALAGYYISGTGYHAVVVSVSGTACTVNTKQNLIATIPNDASIDALSSTAAIIGYTDGSSSYPKAAVISISGTTPSLGSATTLESANTYTTGGQGGEKFCVAVSATSAVMCWLNSTADDLRACAMSISGTTVTGGSVVSLDNTITTGNGWMVTVASPMASRLVFSYTDTTTGYQYLRSAALSGTTLTDNADKTTITGSGTILEGAVSAVGTGFVCAYNDGNLSFKAVAEATAAGLSLYTGSVTLVKRVDLNIMAIAPQGMVVRAADKTVVVVSAESSDSVLVESAAAPDYDTLTDLTGSHPSSSTRVILEVVGES